MEAREIMYATDAIVLKKLDIGEADALYALYTKDFGKVVAHAQGVRKNEAKLRGHLEPFSLSAVRLISGRNGEKLIGASLVNFYERMRSRDATLRLASYAAARLNEHCFAGERDDALWNLVSVAFRALDAPAFPEDGEVRFRKEFDENLSLCLGHGSDGGKADADEV